MQVGIKTLNVRQYPFFSSVSKIRFAVSSYQAMNLYIQIRLLGRSLKPLRIINVKKGEFQNEKKE